MQIVLRGEKKHEGKIKCERRNKGLRLNNMHEGENKLRNVKSRITEKNRHKS